ncbi:MAG: hypothetical protein EPO26_07325 [Chloroflexota bacterium]|nr:MAG: hypothetical protein EPO26_07325 [Chloroflexota bacterium]
MSHLGPGVYAVVLRSAEELTRRQDVLGLRAAGGCDSAIARQLGVSRQRVYQIAHGKNH